VWTALGQYVWSQAAVALVDAVFIGFGVWILGVPFALPIAVLTFFGSFVPIVGALVAVPWPWRNAVRDHRRFPGRALR
jgi:predicted PurR-regulated permease PerM